MSSSPDRMRWMVHALRVVVLGGALLAAAWSVPAQPVAPASTTPYPGIGRPATAKEIAAWDIDVRPDFKGLPQGAGSVAKGMEVWEGKCASCHGIFGESNQVFSPLVGGTTKRDIETGHVARLTDRGYPGRTTLMKVPTVSTLWDYVNRAMPWNAPKSLSVEEVYAVVAYLLNLGGIVADDFTLSDRTIAEVQQRMPNRNGMSTRHALWPGAAFGNDKPDVRAAACMTNCGPEPVVASSLPDFARNAHGNLAEQNRTVGAQRGADTLAPAATAGGAAARAAAPSTPPKAPPTANAGAASAALKLTAQHGCVGCHALDNQLIGPSFRQVAARHGQRPDAVDYLAGKIRSGGSGVWGSIPMPAQALADTELHTIAQWLADGARQ